MAITTFAAIDIGSYEVSMKIFELSKKYGIKEINYLRYRLELGKDAYGDGKISHKQIDELCDVLKSYVTIMREYAVSDYRACATSALRELRNPFILIEQVFRSTGIKIDILSNSEQRFLGYKSIAAMEVDFQKMIQKGTAIIDVGGGSVQVSLFDNDTLVTTQNIKMGNLRIRERLKRLEKETIHYDKLVEEFIHNEIVSFQRMFIKDREIRHVILLGDFFTDALFHDQPSSSRMLTKEQFMGIYDRLVNTSPDLLAAEIGIPLEYASLVIPSTVIYKSFIEAFGAEAMWVPGTLLEDGIAYDYGEKNKIIKTTHNFENDILVAARNIGKRYACNKPHVQQVSLLALKIFDGMKKVHGMGPRERLLLQIAVLLHDCGKYISLEHVAECSYNIIMATEIIGLSHIEREAIANVVRYNTMPFEYFDNISHRSDIGKEIYLVIAKLTAILRIANCMDRSHFQKIKDMRVTLKEQVVILTVDSTVDLTLEEGLIAEKADFFEEIFSVRPILKRKRQ